MADQRILATENMIGANHPTLADTLNRLTLVAHENDGTHKDNLGTIEDLSVTQVAALTSTNLQTISGLTTTQILSLGTAGIASLDTTEISYLDGVTSSVQSQLNGKQASSGNLDVIAGLNTTQIQSLGTAGVAALTTTQIATLGTGNLPTLAALSTTQIQTISSANLATISGLTTTQLLSLGTSGVAALTTTQIATLGTGNLPTISALTTTQVAALSSTNLQTISNLTTTQVLSLGTAGVAALSTAQIATLGTGNLPTIAALSTTQVAALSSDNLQTISSLTATQMLSLGTSGIAALTTGQIQSLAGAPSVNGLLKSNGTTIGVVLSGADIKTINGSSILGSGDLVVSGGGLSDGDKGDITVSDSGATWTIDPGVVNTTKIADLAVSTAKLADASVTNAKLATSAVDIGMVQFRLTLTSGTPITTADVTAATTVYMTPYKGNRIALFDGTNWKMMSATEKSVAVPATTSTMYDVFAYDNSGTVAIEALAWTNDTTRATALALQDGVYVKSGDATRRYIGSFRTTTVSGQTEDSKTKRYVWNYYNRVARALQRNETANATWTYTTATLRQANNNTANQVDTIIGVVEDPIKVRVTVGADNSSANVLHFISIGINSTSVGGPVSDCIGYATKVAGLTEAYVANLNSLPTLGRSYYAWLEYSAATGTTTWRAGNNGAYYAGITGEVMA